MKRMPDSLVLCLVVSLVLSTFARAQQAALIEDFLVLLDKSHPRLMLKDNDLLSLKASIVDDAALQKCWDDVKADADACLEKPPLVYKKVGPRLLSVSRDCLHRIYALAMAYRWTGEDRYAAKAKANLLEVCAFTDWNPSHFLDTAEMSHAVGVGYDWLYDYLDPDSRNTIVRALIENGLKPGLRVYDSNGWWTQSDHNWNQVCNGGMIIGALAIADVEPSYAERIIPAAVKSLPRALKTYAPDGAWGEGPGYWSYATHYTAYGLSALDTALGSTFGLLDVQGLSKAGDFPIYTAGPTGLYLNFADVGERSARRPMACMFWLAGTFHNPLYAYSEHEEIAKRPAGAAHLVWYAAKPPARAARRRLDACFRGPVEVVTMRSAWDDPDAIFVGFKAGYNQVNHGHLDLGAFDRRLGCAVGPRSRFGQLQSARLLGKQTGRPALVILSSELRQSQHLHVGRPGPGPSGYVDFDQCEAESDGSLGGCRSDAGVCRLRPVRFSWREDDCRQDGGPRPGRIHGREIL
ncbi:MAG TPA: hypothetical protein PLO68_00155 [Sedimentisphaerales bacterium]|nr:hypothetical protein [Sedimentisphaerales bacterium]